jgi:metallo-beta-lactamase family protein
LRLTFLGAAGTVTGSKYLLEDGGDRLLVDCGLFQGLKDLRLRNRAPFPVDPGSIGSMLLTHAHLDHSGYLPRLAAQGFRGKVHASAATLDLARILLLDSASLQEEEARHAARHGWSKHNPPMPLYTREEAQACDRLFRSERWNKPFHPLPGWEAVLRKAGHILGASTVAVARAGRTVLFSGDLGRPKDPVLAPPDPCPGADWIVIESTYGDRRHADVDPADAFADLAERVFARCGAVLVPSFAVGRTQSLLHLIWRLRRAGRLAHVPVFVDSPMASDVTRLYLDHPSDHALGPDLAREVFGSATYVRTPEDSKRLSERKGPMVLISASGMATGGRILHHLRAFAPDPKNAVLLAGFQAEGTRGAKLAAGDEEIKIFGGMVPVNAEIAALPNASAHADADEILAWLKTAPRAPERVFVTHGEPAASEALRGRIAAELGWQAHVPRLGESADTGPSATPA